MTSRRRIVLLSASLLVAVVVAGWLSSRGVGVGGLPAGGPAIVAPKLGVDRAAPPHVLLLGTSLTSRGDWPMRLGEELAAAGCNEVVVERLARAGANSRWGEAALIERLQRVPTPTVVVFEFAGNDASLARGMSLRASRAVHERLIAMIGVAGAVPVLLAVSPAWGREHFERPGLARYHAMHGRLAASSGAGLVDTVGNFNALGPEARAAAMPDGLHPTPAAMAELVVPAVVTALLPLVCARRAVAGQAVLPPSTVSTRPVTASPSGDRK